MNCCKEGSDIKNLDYGLYLDGVKKRSFVVSMQTAGRIMRPDLLKKKVYAYIIEVLHSSVDGDGLSIEALTVNKLINYYKSILNLSADMDDLTDSANSIDSDNDQTYDEISKEFLDLYKSTYIIEDKNEINIQIGQNVKPCIIKFDMKTIDWSKFAEYLDTKVNKICGIRPENNTDKQSNIYMIYIGANSLSNYYRMVKDANEPIWGFRNGPILNTIVQKYFHNKNNKIICFYDPNDENLMFYSSYKYIYSIRLSKKYWNIDSFPHTIFLKYITKINIKFNDLKISQNWSVKFIPRGLIIIDLMKIKNTKPNDSVFEKEINEIINNINYPNNFKTTSDQNSQILKKLGIKEISNIDQLLSEINAELKYGYKLLDKFNRYCQIELSNNLIKDICFLI